MIIVVTGGRKFLDREYVFTSLSSVHTAFTITTLVQGGADGADSLAKEWAAEHSIPCVEVKADWDKYGRSAGPRRNQEMLDSYRPAFVVAFPGGRGTKDMLSRARADGYKILHWHLNKDGCEICESAARI